MNSGSSSSGRASDLCNEPDMDLEGWINELYSADLQDSLTNFGLDNKTISPDCASQPNMCIVNSSSVSTADESQNGIPQQMMTVSSLTPNSSTSTLQTSGHILPPVPKFVPNPPSQSSQSRITTDLPQFTNQNQPLKQKVIEQKIVQQPPRHPLISQSTIMFDHQNNNQQMTLDQIRPYSRPVSTIQTIHLQNQKPLGKQSGTIQLQQQQHHMVQLQPLQNFHQNQNQNQTQMQFQQNAGTARILMPEGGRHRVQGVVIGEEQRRPQEHQQQNISSVWSAPVGFKTPKHFPSSESWREYAFREVSHMREIYMDELIRMHRKAELLCSQETNMERKNKYESAKEFLGKMTMFLNLPSVHMIPKYDEKVYNYMNFIVNYLTSFRNKNGGSLQHFDPIDPQRVHHPLDSRSNAPQLQPNNPPSNISQGVVNLQTNMVNPQSSSGFANREATMMNFNQYFPSRRPHGRMPGPLSNGPFQMGTVTPVRIGSFNGAQPNVLGTTQRSNMGPKTSGVNVSSSSMSLLKAATSANFPSRQLNHQPSLANQSVNSEKMKQPTMHKPNELTGSNVGRVMSPLEALLQNSSCSPQFSQQSAQRPIVQPMTQNSVSSWHVNANNVLSPESIARSPFLLGSSSTRAHHEKQYSSSGLSSLSTVEGQRPEIPIIAGLFRNQKSITNQVANMGPSETPIASPMNTSGAEKSKESQDVREPHHRLMEAVKSSSPKALGTSINDIDSAHKDLDSVPDHGEPMERDGKLNSIADDEPANLDHLNIGDEIAFLFTPVPERKVKRKLSSTSESHSLPDFNDDDLVKFLSEDWDIDSVSTSMEKKPKTECKIVAILEEIKEFNSKQLETSMEMVVNSTEDSKSILEGKEGTIVTCQYKNVCFPDLSHPQTGVSSETRPEFCIKLLVPDSYPASSPAILQGSHNNVLSAPWSQLHDEMVSKLDRTVRELPEPTSLGDMAQNWDACARSVITAFLQKRGGKSFSIRHGNWESSSASN